MAGAALMLFVLCFGFSQSTVRGQQTAAYVPFANAREVVVVDEVWTDSSRGRDIPVRIYAPEDSPKEEPAPLVVFSHGGGESATAYDYLGEPLAAAGYVVVFVTHEGSDRAAYERGGMAALRQMQFPDRVADLRFAIDRATSGDAPEWLSGRVDPDRIAAAGQCAGSSTALALAGLTSRGPDGSIDSYRDPRVDAVIALSPQAAARPNPRGESLYDGSWSGVAVPALVVTGTRDYSWFPEVRADSGLLRQAYDRLGSETKFLVSIRGAEHHAFTDSEPYYPAGERDPRHHGWIAAAVVAFCDGWLKGDEQAREWLRTHQLEKETRKACRQEERLSRPEDEPAEYDFGPVTDLVERMMEKHDLEGAGLILFKDDEELYHKTFGAYDDETVIRIASASKWPAVAAVMTLVDDGTIALDDPVSKYIPSFRGEKAGITIRQCLSCTSGLPSRVEGINDPGMSVRKCVDNIAAVPLREPPGTKLRYGGCGFQVAARVAEVVTGQTWYEFFDERIREPLGMTTTRYGRWTVGHGPGGTGGNRALEDRAQNPWVAGTAETSLPHYARLVSTLANGGVYEGRRILSEQCVAEMFRNHTAGLEIGYVAPGALTSVGYGLGTWVWRVDEEGSSLAVSDPGGAGFTPWVDLEAGVAGVLMIDHPYMMVKPDIDRLQQAARDIVLGNEVAAPGEPARGGPGSDQLDRLFQVLDRDKDGALSRDEIPKRAQRLRDAFDRVDADGDGKLSREELQRVLEALQGRGRSSRSR